MLLPHIDALVTLHPNDGEATYLPCFNITGLFFFFSFFSFIFFTSFYCIFFVSKSFFNPAIKHASSYGKREKINLFPRYYQARKARRLLLFCDARPFPEISAEDSGRRVKKRRSSVREDAAERRKSFHHTFAIGKDRPKVIRRTPFMPEEQGGTVMYRSDLRKLA